MSHGTHDRFELIEQLGEGAHAIVWRARDTKLNREVALKVLRGASEVKPSSGQADRLQRFELEMQAAARLNHPNIVCLLESGYASGRPHIAYEMIEGVTLREWVNFVSPKPIGLAIAMAQIAEALEYAHRNGVIHRDIKPDNILVEMNGKPFVTDFGLAQIADKRITEADVSVGTVAYLAPEQTTNDQIDGRVDVFAMGVVLFEMLTGELPFRGTTRAEYLAQLALNDAPLLTTLNRDIHPDLSAICSKCLSRSLVNRYASAQALKVDLERFANGQPTQARPRSWLAKTSQAVLRRSRPLGVFSILIVSVVLTAIWINQTNDAKRVSDLADRIIDETNDAKLERILESVIEEGHQLAVAKILHNRIEEGLDSQAAISTLCGLSILENINQREFQSVTNVIPEGLPNRARSIVKTVRSLDVGALVAICKSELPNFARLEQDGSNTEWISIGLFGGIEHYAEYVCSNHENQRMRFMLQSVLAKCNLSLEQWLQLVETKSNSPELKSLLLIAAADSLSRQEIDVLGFESRLAASCNKVASAQVTMCLRYLELKLNCKVPMSSAKTMRDHEFVDELVHLIKIPSGRMILSDTKINIEEPFWTTACEISQQWIENEFTAEEIKLMEANGDQRLGSTVAAHRLSVVAAMRICNRLSTRTGRSEYYIEINEDQPIDSVVDSKSNGFRLPTQEQWEWLARAQSKTNFFHGAKLDSDDSYSLDLDNFGWFRSSLRSTRDSRFQKGKQKWPNSWGLFDVYGNVAELAIDESSGQFVGCGGTVNVEGKKCTSKRTDLIPTSFSFGLRPVCPWSEY
ncbi:MAG TPA: hypothetical protein DDW52_21825 [Planctomycetaceae bacterium]|nr:hypothetical protein [Planctomycetaceae bacterium]